MAPLRMPAPKINMKAIMGGDGPSHTHGNTYHQNPLLMADIALTYKNGGRLDIVKNRYGVHGTDVPVPMAIDIFSTMIVNMTFKDNQLKMFKEGLKQQIKSAINIALETFHESR